MHTHDGGHNYAYIRADHVIRASVKAEKLLNLLKRMGAVKNPPNYYSNHYHYQEVSKPKRRYNLETVRSASKPFDQLFKQLTGIKAGKPKVGRNTYSKTGLSLWRAVREEQGDMPKSKTADQKQEYIRGKYKESRRHLRRFMQALVYASPRFYRSDGVMRTNDQWLILRSKLKGYRQARYLTFLDAFTNLQMNKRTYVTVFSQPAPANAFDELINARWRRLAFNYKTHNK